MSCDCRGPARLRGQWSASAFRAAAGTRSDERHPPPHPGSSNRRTARAVESCCHDRCRSARLETREGHFPPGSSRQSRGLCTSARWRTMPSFRFRGRSSSLAISSRCSAWRPAESRAAHRGVCPPGTPQRRHRSASPARTGQQSTKPRARQTNPSEPPRSAPRNGQAPAPRRDPAALPLPWPCGTSRRRYPPALPPMRPLRSRMNVSSRVSAIIQNDAAGIERRSLLDERLHIEVYAQL